jgi:hypothetical protein
MKVRTGQQEDPAKAKAKAEAEAKAKAEKAKAEAAAKAAAVKITTNDSTATTGSAAKVYRDPKTGDLVQVKKNDFAGVTTKTLKSDAERAYAANPNKSPEFKPPKGKSGTVVYVKAKKKPKKQMTVTTGNN